MDQGVKPIKLRFRTLMNIQYEDMSIDKSGIWEFSGLIFLGIFELFLKLEESAHNLLQNIHESG